MKNGKDGIKMDKKLMATPCIINGWFSPTYENPCGFSIQFLFAR